MEAKAPYTFKKEERLCGKTLIQELLALQKNKVLLMRKYGLATDLESRLETFVREDKL